MKLKTVLVSAALTLLAGLAQAGTVTLGSSGTVTGSFSNSYTLTVTDAQDYLLSLVTQSKKQDISISSVTLSNGTVTYTFDLTDDGTWLSSSSWWTTAATSSLGVSYSLQHQTYSLSEIYLTAGLWTITVSGTDTESKVASSYSITANAVPEPQTLGLSAAALGALLWVRRRQQRQQQNGA